MFTSVTWSQFLSYTALLLAFYYVAIGLTFYRKELRRFLTKYCPLPSTGKGGPELKGITGPVTPVDMAVTEAASLQVAGPEAAPALSAETTQPLQAGPLRELVHLLQETDVLLSHVTGSGAPKEDFLPLLGLLAAKSPSLLQPSYREPVTRLLLVLCRDRLPFEVKTEDLQQLWQQQTA